MNVVGYGAAYLPERSEGASQYMYTEILVIAKEMLTVAPKRSISKGQLKAGYSCDRDFPRDARDGVQTGATVNGPSMTREGSQSHRLS